MDSDFQENIVLEEFKNSSNTEQLNLLVKLLRVSHPEVKYYFQLKIEDITKYDIIGGLPIEIAEKIFLYVDLNSVLKCRRVSQHWKDKINKCCLIWLPNLQKYCIDVESLKKNKIVKTPEKYLPPSLEKNLDVIGERLFNFSTAESSLSIDNVSMFNDICNANSFIMGRKLLSSLENQAGFEHIIDYDCRGSNVVMTMNSEIIAYAREDRHIVVKYTNFPHKKISVFEAHQCADIKIYEDKLITGAYDRSICIWKWDTGKLICRLEGSVKPVYSLDVANCVLVSSDGKSVITWDLINYKMLHKTPCFNEGHVEELTVINPNSNELLKQVHADCLLVTRTNRELKVWLCNRDGVLTQLSSLGFTKEINNLQPFIRVNQENVACSSEYGILIWSLLDFNLVKHVERNWCHACQFTMKTFPRLPRSNNCRVILLYYSDTFVLQYFVHKNRFQLFGTRQDSKVELSWDFPSNEKWPWSHRKPGIATLVQNFENGFSLQTKISMFVATQGKKIYCMLFDASDLDFNMEQRFADTYSSEVMLVESFCSV